MKLRLALAALGLALPLAAFAHGFTIGALEIGHPYSVETAPGVRTGAGYLSVTNTGPSPDRLLAVKADFPKVEIHETATDAAGVARMGPVAGVEIAPGATVELAPRGVHVMFMGLPAPLAAGARFPATLVFEHAGEVAVEFVVETRKAGDEPAHEHPAPAN
jgi:copper(I)-binding protein